MDFHEIIKEMPIFSGGITLLRLAVDAYKAFARSGDKKLAERVYLFDSHLKPLYDDLSGIHANYLLVYQKVREALRPAFMDPQLQTPEFLHSVVDSFIKDRQENVMQRTALRSNAAALVFSTTKLQLEAAFLFSILNYFLRNHAPGDSTETMAMLANAIAEEGPDKYINTPSSVTLELFRKAKDISEVSTIVGAEEDSLSRYWTDVIKQYGKLQNVMIKWRQIKE